jgi:prolyl-tRNA synthetase
MSKGPSKAKRGIPPKSNFNEWYPFIVEASELIDKRYPIKGMDVWRPYGWKTMRLIDSHTHSEMERTGHGECNFPLLIPEDLLEKENRLVSLLKRAREQGVDPDELRHEEEDAGFKKEVYWVRHAGENKLDVPMFLRPTSETAMYTMFPLWIRSHADLPLKIYQTVNTFRYETKQTRSFIRVREIHFFEAHTAHKNEEDATQQIEEDLDIVNRLMHKFALPAIISKRPIWDTFPGAWYTIGIDVIMPNGRTLQVASVHHYRDQWAKAFDITYENKEGTHAYVHQTTYGMSERLLGAIVGMHGDDAGLKLPPTVSPYQVVMIPIISKETSADVKSALKKIAERLQRNGVRIHIDGRDIRPGQKYFDWEIKGVPLRLDFGARDLKSNSIMCTTRNGVKSSIDLNNLETEVKLKLEEVHTEMVTYAENRLEEVIIKLPKLYKDEDGWKISEKLEDDKIYWTNFDGTDSDAEVIEKLTGLSFLGDSLEQLSDEVECCISGKPTNRKIYLAKTY